TKRTYVAEGLALSSGVKAAITEYYSVNGVWPVTNAEAGLTRGDHITGSSVSAIWIALGLGAQKGTLVKDVTNIVIYYNQKVIGSSTQAQLGTQPGYIGDARQNTIVLAPNVTNSSISSKPTIQWVCRAVDINRIKMRWLPASCRATIEDNL
ncbi:pilin, partial [Wohlfahrtiimonas populi]|uniref:pilin n=1 Tax=Wohlfahrtiimonas populi TaxID=1940240 RepID=UPI00098D25AF